MLPVFLSSENGPPRNNNFLKGGFMKKMFKIVFVVAVIFIIIFSYALGRADRRIEDIDKGKEIAYTEIRGILSLRMTENKMFYVADLGIKFYPIRPDTARLKFVPPTDFELTHPVLAAKLEEAAR